jgi:hypothetical protein
MLVPFIMLLLVTIALILERKFQEDKINEIYEEKFEIWKKHQTNDTKPSTKELVGLVYLQDYQLSIDILDKRAEDPLIRKQYTLRDTVKEINNEDNNTTTN